MICLLHGYLLEGSGSNLWTRSVLRALCRTGHTVHLVCQDPRPEAYSFIAEAHIYHADGARETWFQREVPYPGRCIMHKPKLGDTLPVYVWDKYEEFPRVVPMIDLPDHEIESYLSRNVTVVREIVRRHDITVMQANHLVLMSVVAQRVSAETGVPYVIMPHGSALEYAVKKDPRFHEMAQAALAGAKRVLVSADELGERVVATFPKLRGLKQKLGEVRVGVDTSDFEPIARAERVRNIEAVNALIAPLPRGRTRLQTESFQARLVEDQTPGAVDAALADAARYDGKHPDVDAEADLRGIDWNSGAALIFVGRLIVAKGIHCLIAALPEILDRYPNAQLVVAGHGPLREPLEALLFALRTGNRRLADWLAAGDPAQELLVSERMAGLPEYWRALEAEGRLDEYWKTAERLLRVDTVRFLGYLTHRELSWIFPCCDVGVFPSMVKESGPMVFLEALASGCFPVGTYFAGTKQKIDVVTPYLEAGDAEWMKVRPDAEHIVADLARTVPGALSVRDRYCKVLRRIAEQEYDWQPIAAKLATTLDSVAASANSLIVSRSQSE